MSTASLPIFLVFAGAAIMIGNIIGYLFFRKAVRKIFSASQKTTELMLVAYIVLLAFFLIGYIGLGLLFLFPIFEINNWLVSAIFFFGSLFVSLGIFIELRLCRSLEHSNLEIIQGLIRAVEARDANLRGHSSDVASLSVLIYNALPSKLQRQISLHDLQYSALLHDIGKLGVSEVVLNKPSSLTAEEWAEIKQHPAIGSQMLAALPSCQEFARYLLYHHERIDGKGYLGMPGDEIPLISRVIAVADTYSALTMDRSYRRSRTHAQAEEILRSCMGTQLDAELVAIFLTCTEEEIETCRALSDSALLAKAGL